MSVVFGHFHWDTHSHSHEAPEHMRVVLSQLVNDLQLLATERQDALTLLAELAHRWASPVREALAQELNTRQSEH